MCYTPQKHLHAEVIKAWADGARILVLTPGSRAWGLATSPSWATSNEYHVVPNYVPEEYLQLYIEWKNGAVIQYHNGRRWVNSSFPPQWARDTHYRVKPKAERVRLFWWRPSTTNRPTVDMVTEQDQQREPRENWSGFIRWASEWIEVEAE